MKRLLIIILLIIPCSVLAMDGKVWVGKYFGKNTTARAPNDYTSNPKFIAGLEISERVWRLRPYTSIETLMDEYDDEYGSFHPSSVKYKLGIDATLYSDKDRTINLNLEHMCNHGIDKWTGTVEQYNKIQLEYRW